jgi:uncharacterized protein
MSDQMRRLLATRIGEYANKLGLAEFSVVFHGGEPLLAGAECLVETAEWIRSASPAANISFSLQTNGTLLNEAMIEAFAGAGFGISLSIDGTRAANDLHRLDHQGRSSFEATLRGLEFLERHRKVYAGLISVIDPAIEPEQLFKFFAPRHPPRLDFLLPDAHHERQPSGRSADPGIYERWLKRAFDIWFDQYPNLPIRTFDALLSGCVGLPSGTDAFGFGTPSMLTIETDGSYHDLDVLKITTEGASSIGLNLVEHSFADAAASDQFAAHRELLTFSGLSQACQSCREVTICAGGSVPHRFSSAGFRNPTVYCREMLSLIAHVRSRLNGAIATAANSDSAEAAPALEFTEWERPETSRYSIDYLLDRCVQDFTPEWEDVLARIEAGFPELNADVRRLQSLDRESHRRVILEPAVRLWTTVMAAAFRGKRMSSASGRVAEADPHYLRTIAARTQDGGSAIYPRLHRPDHWLRAPFDTDIVFEDPAVAAEGVPLVTQAIGIIRHWRPAVLEEIQKIDPDIQFVRDQTAAPESIVSFSDNTTPGCLYIGIRTADGWTDPHHLAESIIHEHRHQKLYLLQRAVPMLEADAPLVVSPWRKDLRPPSGLLHAVFVFVHILEFWGHWATCDGADDDLRARAARDCRIIERRLTDGFATLRQTRLTREGLKLTDILQGVFERLALCRI